MTYLLAWFLLSVPVSLVLGGVLARRAVDLDERLEPHVLTDLDMRVAVVERADTDRIADDRRSVPA